LPEPFPQQSDDVGLVAKNCRDLLLPRLAS
jgi:hypothetical protein